jgi:hypothetical protein
MSKDFPNKAEAGIAAPADKPDRVGPVAGVTEPEMGTKAAPKSENLASPAEHAKAMGGVKTIERSAVVNGQPAKFELFHQFHAGAEALHGWREHEHHEGKSIQLSADDYKAALKAATEPVTRVVDKDGKPTGEPIDSHKAAAEGIPTITDYEPHKPALSPHKGKGL